MSSRFYKFGEFVLSIDRRELFKQQGTELVSKAMLTDLKFKVLLHLIENRGKIITKEELLDRFWTRGEKVFEDSNLTTVIGYLRTDLDDEKISDENGKKYHRFINTIHKIGYRFTAEVKEEENLDDILQDNTTQSVVPFNPPKRNDDLIGFKENLLSNQSAERIETQITLPSNLAKVISGEKSESSETNETVEKLNLQSNENITVDGENNVFSSSRLESEAAHSTENVQMNSSDTVPVQLEGANFSQNESLPLKLITGKIYWTSLIITIILIALTVAVHFLATAFAVDDKAFGRNPIDYFIQAGICLIFAAISVAFVIPSIKREDFSNKVVRDSFHQFLTGWLLIWITWFLLYLYFVVVLLLAGRGWEIWNSAAQTTIDFLNACTSAAFFYTFLVMDVKSVSTDIDPARDQKFRQSFKVIIGISALITLLAGIGRVNQFDPLIYLSGLFAAVSMFYFFGRLDSHHMDVNRWFLAPLYSYASIQVIGPKLVDFGDSAAKKAEPLSLFFYLLLLFKVYLFAVVSIWLVNGAFKTYFTEAFNYIERKSSK